MRNTILLLAALAALACGGVYRDAGLGLYPFLKMDVGARSAALGGTGAVNGGGLSIFSNPALLSGQGPGVSAGHNQWYGSTTQSFLAAVGTLGGNVTGSLGFRSVSTTDIEFRDSPSSDPVDTFNAHDFSFDGAAALAAGRFSIGMGIKVIHEKIWLESSNGWAVDLGVAFRPSGGLLLTGAYLHSGPEVSMDDQKFRFPRTWVFAGRWDTPVPLGTASLSAQVQRPLDNETRGGAGLEYRPVDWAALRGGYRFNDDSAGLTAGAGLEASGWTLDYAFVPGSYSLGTAHRFTLSRSL